MSSKKENMYLVDNMWSQNPNAMIGKFEVAPTPQAQAMWEIVKKNPDGYAIGFSYTEDATGKKELIGLSLTLSPIKKTP